MWRGSECGSVLMGRRSWWSRSRFIFWRSWSLWGTTVWVLLHEEGSEEPCHGVDRLKACGRSGIWLKETSELERMWRPLKLSSNRWSLKSVREDDFIGRVIGEFLRLRDFRDLLCSPP